jgi:hypothetical protein
MAVSKKLENPYTGSTVPSNLYIGRVWHEITVAGLYIGSWVWNGTYWLSIQAFKEDITTTLGNTVSNVVFDLDPASNILLTAINASVQCNVLATATVNWGWNLSRINSAGVLTSLATGNNIGQPANTWQNFNTPLNIHVNLAATGAKGIRYLDTRTGNISKAGTISFTYRKARI